VRQKEREALQDRLSDAFINYSDRINKGFVDLEAMTRLTSQLQIDDGGAIGQLMDLMQDIVREANKLGRKVL
jgi:hypothetical protein